MRIVTLVLAAGRGARMGGPKALLRAFGVPLALLHARTRLRHESSSVVLVVRGDVADTLRRSPSCDARIHFVESDRPDAEGPAGSIAAAVSSGMLDAADVVIVSPVDVVPARSSSVSALASALSNVCSAARFEHGHPIACRLDVLRDHYEGFASPPLRNVLAGLGVGCATLPIPPDDPWLQRDIDMPEDALAVLGTAPAFIALR